MITEPSAEKAQPFAHNDGGNLIAVRCDDCGTIVVVGYHHECVFLPGQPSPGLPPVQDNATDEGRGA